MRFSSVVFHLRLVPPLLLPELLPELRAEEVAGRLTLKRRSGRPLVVTGRGLAYRRSGMPSFRRTVPMRAPPLLLLRGGVGAGRGM